ncbi:ABC transporter permease [Agromyces allii]|uniref:ABC transporter permease n=1 Tax=Agromyces allii TaxID=393607 RepID=A0ABN2RB94_9MICO|nr:ABC transporter permease [Agromyces allii]
MTLQFEDRAVAEHDEHAETALAEVPGGIAVVGTTPARARPRRSARVVQLTQPSFILSALLVVAVVTAAFLPTLFTSLDPYATDLANKLAAPTWQHPLGTDNLGRDQYARVVYGTGNTLIASLLAVVLGLSVSAVLGILAGYLGGWVDEVVGRFVDIFLAVPGLLVSLMIVTTLGYGTINIAIAVGIGSVAAFTRILRAEVLRVRESDFVTAARLSGLRWWSILPRHVFPHSIGPLIALLALQFGEALLAISALSFLGFGVQPPEPEWGLLVSEGRTYLSSAWWLAILPGIVIVLVVLAANRVSKFIEKVT